jgi:hypothetical protein
MINEPPREGGESSSFSEPFIGVSERPGVREIFTGLEKRESRADGENRAGPGNTTLRTGDSPTLDPGIRRMGGGRVSKSLWDRNERTALVKRA